ncbi:MAG: glycosyltransferase [Thiohalocapsa sp.]
MTRIACFFSTSGHSGVDRAAKHLIPALAKRGYCVDLLKVRRHGPELDDVPDGVRVIDLGSRHTYACIPSITRYLRRERPEVMLSDKDRVNRSALAARTLARVPTRLIFSSGTTISIDLANRGVLERWVQRNSMRHLYPRANRVIVTSAGVANDMSEYSGLDRDHIQVVASPVVPESLFEQDQPLPDHAWFAPGEPPVILGVGELCSRKDFETLIRAFARLRRTGACRLMILGRGSQRNQLLGLAQDLGVDADFALPGFVSDPYRYMAHAALVAFTSLWEGLGFVLIEALAVGTPVVSTDCPSGPSEILQGGRYGPLTPLRDPDALANAIARTLDEPLAPELLRQAARPYAIEASADAYLDAMDLPRAAAESGTEIGEVS